MAVHQGEYHNRETLYISAALHSYNWLPVIFNVHPSRLTDSKETSDLFHSSVPVRSKRPASMVIPLPTWAGSREESDDPYSLSSQSIAVRQYHNIVLCSETYLVLSQLYSSIILRTCPFLGDSLIAQRIY